MPTWIERIADKQTDTRKTLEELKKKYQKKVVEPPPSSKLELLFPELRGDNPFRAVSERVTAPMPSPKSLPSPEKVIKPGNELPEPRTGAGFVLDILSGRQTTENPQGLTPVEYARQFPLAEAAIVGIPAVVTLGVAGYEGLKAATDSLLNVSIMRNLSMQAQARNIPLSKEEAQIFANDLTNMLSRRFSMTQNWKNAFDFVRGKYVPKPEATQEAENIVQTALTQYNPWLIPKGTQTGAMAFGGKRFEGLPKKPIISVPTATTGAVVKPAITPEVTPAPEVTPSTRLSEITQRMKELNTKIQTTKVGRPSKNTLAIREKAQTEFDTLSKEADELTKQIVGKVTPQVPTAPVEEVAPAEEVTQLAEQVKAKLEPPTKLPTLSEQISTAFDDINGELEAWRLSVRGMRREGAIEARKAIKLLETEVKSAKAIVSKIAPADVRKMRQQVMATAHFKGISKTQTQAIFKRVTGKTGLTKMTEAQLGDVLKVVKEARPISIKGKKVITQATEKTIQSLKATLIKENVLSEQGYQNIKAYLRLHTDKYLTPRMFIGEKEAKELIRTMNAEAEVGLLKKQNDLAKVLETQPEYKAVIDKLETRALKEKVITANKGAKVSPLWDYWVYNERLQNRTDKPFSDLYRLTLDTSLENDNILLTELKRAADSTPDYAKIIADKSAGERIRNYLASKIGQKVKIKEMSEGEIALAKEYERGFFAEVPNVRFQRFLTSYHNNDGDIIKIVNDFPQAATDKAVRDDLREAIKIYESGGANQLKRFLDTKTWGVINTGYEPHSYINPKLVERRIQSSVSKGMLHVREDLANQKQLEKMTIHEAYENYKRRMGNLKLEPFFRKYNQLLKEAAPQLGDSGDIANNLSLMMLHMKHGATITHPLARILARMGGYISSVVYIPPHLGLRNLYQPIWLNPYRQELVNPLNKPLSEAALAYFDIYGQGGNQLIESLLQTYLGKGRVATFIRRTSPMGISETMNNKWTYWAMVNKATRALNEYRSTKDLSKFVKNSGMEDFTLRQQKEVLELMALGKEEEATWFIGRKINQNTNMIYDQRQAGPMTAGEFGTLAGSLLRFPRGYGQRMYEQAEKLKSGNWREKRLALSVIAGSIVMGIIGNTIYQKITGKKGSPYNPLSVITWSPGGLTFGAAQDTSNLISDIFAAASGDEDALMRLPSGLERGSNLLVPYYVVIINSLEAMSDTKGADRLAIRKVIALIKKDYHPNEASYEKERDWIGKLQHALFGGEPPEAEKEPEKPKSFKKTTPTFKKPLTKPKTFKKETNPFRK